MPGMAGIKQGTIVDDTLLQDAAVTFDASFVTAYEQTSEEAAAHEAFTMMVGVRGKKVRFPIAGLLPGLRKWVGERIAHKLNRYAMEAEVETFEDTVEVDVDELDDDQIGGYTPYFAELGRQSRLWPRDLVTAKLLAGTSSLCFDGQYFFDVDHPVDPANSAAGVYSNLLSGGGSALSETGLDAARTAMSRLKGPDGRVLRVRGDTIVIPPQLELTARKLLEVANYSTGGDNPMKGIARYLVLEELEVEPASWYLAATKGAMKPLVFLQRQSPVVTALDRADSPNVFHHNRAQYGVKARGAATYGMPFLMIKNVGS